MHVRAQYIYFDEPKPSTTRMKKQRVQALKSYNSDTSQWAELPELQIADGPPLES